MKDKNNFKLTSMRFYQIQFGIINKKLVKYAWNIERLWKQICLENLEKLEKSLKIR